MAYSPARPLPPDLQRVVARCLEKEPARRFQGAADLAFVLESAPRRVGPAGGSRRSGACPEGAVPSARHRRRCPVPSAGRGSRLDPPQAPDPASAVAIRLVTYSGHDTSPAVSPDGKTIAFTSDRDGQPRIWLKQLKGGGEVALTAGPDDFPRFSPDGTSVLFIHSEGGSTSLHRITLLGNDPHKVVEDAEQGDWSPDGKQIAFVRLRREQDKILSALFLIDAAGGAERELTRFEGELVGFPRWSPDGRHIILNTPPLITSGVLRKLVPRGCEGRKLPGNPARVPGHALHRRLGLRRRDRLLAVRIDYRRPVPRERRPGFPRKHPHAPPSSPLLGGPAAARPSTSSRTGGSSSTA